MILVQVEFDIDVSPPGRKSLREFPPYNVGFDGGYLGWTMCIVGDRLEIRSPASADDSISMTPAMKMEMDANGVEKVVGMVSVPLHHCTLRYAGASFDAPETSAPSAALVAKQAAPPPPPVPKPKPKPAPQPEAKQPHPGPGKAAQPHQPTPAKRPPGARTFAPAPISKEIEVDGNAPKKREVIPLDAE